MVVLFISTVQTPFLQSLPTRLCGWGLWAGPSTVTQDTTTTARPRYPCTRIVGKVLLSAVVLTPGIEPADRPSHR
uniref:Putative secreted peptide n=1 Tax=Anopheles braziliensis TaxID=58242 RepID=A0A2M3ZR66_9DIPT